MLPLDLHVLGLPPAFNLSHDQTLFVPETNPLLFYEIITQRASVTLKENGLLAFEINQGYGKEVVSLLEKFSFRQIELLKDIPGRDRMVFGRR